jgi:hypothetical protein
MEFIMEGMAIAVRMAMMARETTSSAMLNPRLRLREEGESFALRFKLGFPHSGGEQINRQVRGPNPNSVQVRGREPAHASTTKQSTFLG